MALVVLGAAVCPSLKAQKRAAQFAQSKTEMSTMHRTMVQHGKRFDAWDALPEWGRVIPWAAVRRPRSLSSATIRSVGHRAVILGDLDGKERYELLTSLVVPRPIALVSTQDAKGRPNIAPFSFFMLAGFAPPSVAFSPVTNLDGSQKTTLSNIALTGEFVVNLVGRGQSEAMNQAGVDYPPETDKWDVAGLSPVPCRLVRPARAAECPVALECRLFRIVEHGHGPSSARYVIGEVLALHLADGLDGTEFRPIARMGGKSYLDTKSGKLFEMARPNEPSPTSEGR
jgi:flavin reductase (DIM6/NTAB) family NADH-FMN oxidoreductase RutF